MMRSALKVLVPAVTASLLLAACGSSNSSSASSTKTTTAASSAATPVSSEAGEPVVKTASNATLHTTVLVNSEGMTLYRLTGERSGKFICTSTACVKVWHPVTVSSTSVPAGSVASISTVKRPDGTLQVAYKGEPLYTFTGDTSAGEAKGQGIKDVGTWTAVSIGAASASSAPAGAAAPVTESPPATESAPTTESAPAGETAPAAPASSGGGYGY